MNRLVVAFQIAVIFSAAVLAPFPTGAALHSQNQDAATLYQQAVTSLAAEKFEDAIQALKEAVKLQPDYADAYALMAEAYDGMRDFKKASEARKQVLEARKRIVKAEPNSAVAFDNLGSAYSDADEEKKAIEAYRQSIRLDPKVANVHYKLGVLLNQFDKRQSAIDEYNVLQKLDGDLAQDLYNLIYQPLIPVAADGTVRLRSIVFDAKGSPIDGLTNADFTVTEDGSPQSISVTTTGDAPSFYGVLVDTSGSLRPVFNLALAATKRLVEKMKPADQTLLVRFVSSDKVETVQEFTSRKKKLLDEIGTLYIEGGQSAVLDGVYLTAQRLAGYKFPNRNPRRVLLLLSDGEDRASYYNTESVLQLLRKSDVQIFAISFSCDNDGKLNLNPPRKSVELLKALTAETGGATFFPKSPAELATAIDAIFEFLRAEYTIQYKPVHDIEFDKYRRVSVATAASQSGSTTILVRPGYLVSKK